MKTIAKYLLGDKESLGKRSWLTNIAMYGLTFLQLNSIVKSINGRDAISIICWVLMALGIIIGNGLLLNWKRNGIIVIFSSIAFLSIPLIRNSEFDFFLIRCGILLFITLIYWLCLLIPKQGVSTWKQCEKSNTKIKTLGIIMCTLYILFVALFPIIMSKKEGFKQDYYKNGVYTIDAYFSPNPYSQMNLANRMVFTYRFNRIENVQEKATYWYEKALEKNKTYIDNISRNYGIDKRDDRQDYIYVNYIYAMIELGDVHKAWSVYYKALGQSDRERIDSDILSQEYDSQLKYTYPKVIEILGILR